MRKRGYRVEYRRVEGRAWTTVRPVFPAAPDAERFASTLARLSYVDQARVRLV